jgi:signal peptidase I
MNPTLENNDQLIVDKLSYHLGNPRRFDIVVFPYPQERGVHFIKRVIGMPGETVQILEDGSILIDGKVLEEVYGNETITPDHIGRAINPVVLGEDEYFVMGDNRNNSKDSRDPSVGSIKRDDIVGKAWLRIWPFNHFGFLKHT